MAVDRLTDYDLMIVLAILVAGERAGAAAIARELRWRDCRSVVLGEIHAALDRLEGNGLVVSCGGGPGSPRRRGARRVFEVTPAGLRAVESTQRALVARWKELPELEDEPLLSDLVGEYSARRWQTWLWYLAQHA